VLACLLACHCSLLVSNATCNAASGIRLHPHLGWLLNMAPPRCASPTSLQTLRFKLHSNTLPPSARHCLELAADPRRQLQPQGNGMGTLRGGRYCLLMSE
jgi:hypothetical protein